jgi:uncharacterized protein YbbC (DUF1343 family)
MIKLGLDQFKNIYGKIALVTNATGVDSNLIYNFDKLENVSLIFTPEQGLYGTMLDGESIGDSYIKGIKVRSLYGSIKSPRDEDLDGIDAIVYDIEDAGVRYFTYISTMKLVMESAKKNGIRMIVLDRPNPIRADEIYGPILPESNLSFVGIESIPIKYGMTPGELALFFNRKINAEIEIKSMEGYSRSMWHEDALNYYVPLSLHLPTMESVVNYQAFCLLEATNISVGRGTPSPFMQFGAPGLEKVETDVEGIKLRHVKFRPMYSLYSGELIDGYYVHILDRSKYDPFKLVFDIMKSYNRLEINKKKMDLLLGDDSIYNYISGSVTYEEILEKWNSHLEKFNEIRKKFLIYS